MNASAWACTFTGIGLLGLVALDIYRTILHSPLSAISDPPQAVTYLVSLTPALERKRTEGLSFYHQARQGADVAGVLIQHFVGGRFVGLESSFAEAARDLQRLLESRIEHPLIHYFHPTLVHKSLPRMLFLVLEACAVTRACLDGQAYEELCRHP